MLGKYTGAIVDPNKDIVVSTKISDIIKEHWNETRESSEITLEKKDPIWKEWWIGASSISKACPKMFALMCANGVSSEVLNSETLWNFGQGTMYHKLFQQNILLSFPDGMLHGRWKRRRRNGTLDWTMFKNEVPEGVLLERGWGPKPIGDGWEYDEPKLRIPDNRVVVKIDAILADDDGLEVQEIKTEKSYARDILNPMLGGRPRESHIEQVHVGMWATGIGRARIIYVFKGERTFSSSILEHVVHRDERIIDDLKTRTRKCVDAVKKIESICGSDERIVAAKEMERLPECKLKSKGKPKYCDARDLCFGVRKKKKK